LDEIERFLAIAHAQADADRVLVTLLCVELERRQQRTRKADDVSALERLRTLVVEQALRFGRSAVHVSGGRVFVVFDGPARAIRCGCAIGAEARRSRTAVRLGLHTGECDMVAGVPRGVVVDIGSGVAALARPGEVLVTRTVVDLVAGSGLRFTDRGMHTLAKGRKGWRVYAVRQG